MNPEEKAFVNGLRNEVICSEITAYLQRLPENSVHCVVTSPPYWGLRDYGVTGQIGLEESPEKYVERMVEVFREIRRVLRKDGTCWLNIGDSYSTNAPSGSQGKTGQRSDREFTAAGMPAKRGFGLKPKDLCMIPHRLAIALQADGWWVRSDIVWYKNNPMPESVTDRPTKAHEYIFLLTKSEKYFYDAEAIKEKCVNDESRPNGITRNRDLQYDRKENRMKAEGIRPNKVPANWHQGSRGEHGTDPIQRPSAKRGSFQGKTEQMAGQDRNAFRAVTEYRNKRDVWEIQSQPFAEAHFATFPEKLVEPCIFAGSPEVACSECGAPRVRIFERPEIGHAESETKYDETMTAGRLARKRQAYRAEGMENPPDKIFTGYKTCKCGKPFERPLVLDPFGGSGTVAYVCQKSGRDFLYCDLNPEYCEIAKARTKQQGLL